MKTENQTEDPPEHVATFAELAGILNMSRSTLYDMRRRDRRFPGRCAGFCPLWTTPQRQRFVHTLDHKFEQGVTNFW